MTVATGSVTVFSFLWCIHVIAIMIVREPLQTEFSHSDVKGVGVEAVTLKKQVIAYSFSSELKQN